MLQANARMKSKRILFICPYPFNVAPSQRLKFEQYYPYFKEAGYEIEISPFINNAFWNIIYKKGNFVQKAFHTFSGYSKRIKDLFRLRHYDIIYIHLWVTPFGFPFFERLYRVFGKKIVYDIDDLVYLSDVKSKAHEIVNFIKGRKKPLYLMKSSDHVITCTPYLDQFVRKYNQRTTDISSTVNTELYSPKKDYTVDDKFVIGWSGSHSTLKYLHLLDNVFLDLAKRHSFKLLVMGVGDDSFAINGVDVEAIPWDEKYELEVINRFDIGVYPLPDEKWVLGKSGLKAIQYMAMGIPTVATAVGANFRVIENGISGFLVKDQREWIDALEKLLSDASLRRCIGMEARRRVEDFFSVKANKGTYLNILQLLEGKVK
jgi:glycosyltransferase involved in cell wall biosynthesis